MAITPEKAKELYKEKCDRQYQDIVADIDDYILNNYVPVPGHVINLDTVISVEAERRYFQRLKLDYLETGWNLYICPNTGFIFIKPLDGRG